MRIVAATLLVAPLPVRADSSPFFAVCGKMTLTGNKFCGAPWVEAIDFFFDYLSAPGQFVIFDSLIAAVFLPLECATGRDNRS